MRNTFQAIATAVTMLVLVGTVNAQQPGAAASAEKPRTQQFGLTTEELEQTIEKVEALIAKYMREAGFEYLACDCQTVKKGMSAHKSLPGVSEEEFIGKFDVELLSQLRRPGVSEEEFIGKYGFGLSTWYTGKAPQLADGYSPTREGLGQRNIEIFKKLSAADQVKYNRALFGENTDASFAVGLEIENFSRCGGCTRKAIEQVFKPEQLKPNYVNPQAGRIKNHPMMTTALRVYANAMREEGLAYKHPDEVEADIRERLNVLTKGGTISVDKMPPEQLADLKKLQDYERKVAMKNFELQKSVFGRIEEQIEFLLAK